MKKISAFLLTVVLIGLAFVPAVAAAPPTAVAGDWTWKPLGYSLEKLAGGNQFLYGTELSS
jgi:hypothetical protein